MKRITDIRDIDVVSIADSKLMPHPADLARWEGLYRVDVDRGIFRLVVEEQQQCVP
jgi:hypothetical protein